MLNTQRIAWTLGLAVAIAAVVQFGLDADPLVLLAALFSILCGLYGFWLFGVFDLRGWISLAYMTGNVLIAFVAKTAFLQSLDSNLYDARTSYFVQAICSFAMLCALILTVWIDMGKPLMPAVTDLTVLRLMSMWCLIIGFGVSLIQIFFARLGDVSYGGLNVFGNLLYLGIICRTALLLLRSDGRRMLDPLLLVVLALATLSGVLSTGKSETAYPSVCFLITVIFFKGRLPRRYVVGLAAGVVVFLAITPIMLTWRYMGLRNLPLGKEIEYLETMPLLDKDELALLAAKHARMKSVYYNYYGEHQGQLILGRFSSIQQIDPIIAATDMRGKIGGKVILDGFRSIVPKFVDENKPKEVQGFDIIRILGLYHGGGAHPSVPLAAVVYAAYGLEGVMWIPFVTFLVYLLVLKKLSWDIRGNVFIIFLFALNVSTVHSAGFQGFVEVLLRDLPLLCIAVWSMQWMAVFLTRHQREFPN